MVRLAVFFLVAGVVVSAPAYADEPAAWTPDGGERTAVTRSPAAFEGLEYLTAIRLHLILGGYIEGGLGGVDLDTGDLLLVLPRSSLSIELGLVEAVTPLGRLPEPGSPEAAAPPPLMVTREHVEYRMRPSWRSGAGLALSFVLPGAGQWIQEERRELGFVFLAGAALFVGSGLLALYGPTSYTEQQRRTVGALMFGFAGSVSIFAGVHAYSAGLRRRPVKVRPAGRHGLAD